MNEPPKRIFALCSYNTEHENIIVLLSCISFSCCPMPFAIRLLYDTVLIAFFIKIPNFFIVYLQYF